MSTIIETVVLENAITIYENPNFTGRSKLLTVGKYRFFKSEDFNDVVSSIRIPAGLVAILYEDADDSGGYGRSVDLLEDCVDLSKYDFNDKVSYITIFSTTNQQGLVWKRNSLQNGRFMGGHWERPRAVGNPPNPVAVVSPPIPAHTPPPNTIADILVMGPHSFITSLRPKTFLDRDSSWWEIVTSDQMGVIGNDYRGHEEIGSAAFERASNNRFIPDFLNFWYPQRAPNDHRPYHKRTLVGKVEGASIADISGTYQDYDVDIYITPNEKYQYLIADAHPREYTDIMSIQYKGTLGQLGQPDCDDSESIADFNVVEAEIQPSSDIHSGTAERLRDMILARGRQDIGVYGPWIYDKGHCCHSEIHPAEQIWWRDEISNKEKKYTLNVFCDASKRFWYRDQMDDGTKLKPWGAPPIKGLFAIAFEAKVGRPAVKFEVSNIDHYNVAIFPDSNQVYDLIYENNKLVTFTPNNDAFKVTFENVHFVEPHTVRGFLVIETSVGTMTQTTTDYPPGLDVNKVDEELERSGFKKEEGHYMFTITQTNPAPDMQGGGIWNSDFATPVTTTHGITTNQ